MSWENNENCREEVDSLSYLQLVFHLKMKSFTQTKLKLVLNVILYEWKDTFMLITWKCLLNLVIQEHIFHSSYVLHWKQNSENISINHRQ